jgi:lipoyl(octanoyl) transferase
MKIKYLGHADYASTLAAMQTFTAQRADGCEDELWVCEHPPTFTEGLASRATHLLRASEIPVVRTDRGGQITYHGPGQVVAYPLINLHTAGYFVKEYVFRLEEAVLRTLRAWGVTGHRLVGAPGIYVRRDDPHGHSQLPVLANNAPLRFNGLGKIAALGIKVSRHCTYHGLALNVAMDLGPFSHINPCGYAGLQTVDLSTIGVQVSMQEASQALGARLLTALSP